MNYALPRRSSPGGLRRGGLLAVVLALHGVAFAVMLTVRTVRPALPEMPLMVHFIDPPKPVEVALSVAQALPVVAPAPPAPDPPEPKPEPKPIPKPEPKPVPKPRPVPRPVLQPVPQMAPPLETTSSSEPAPADAAIRVAAEPASAPAPAAKSENAESANAAAGASRGGGQGPAVGARFDAGYLNNPAPPYPPQSRRRGEEGRVILRVHVSKDGRVQEVEVHTSSGSRRLDESALDTVRKWRFIPASRGGTAIDSRVLVPILFRLEQ
jgi:protein TonB